MSVCQTLANTLNIAPIYYKKFDKLINYSLGLKLQERLYQLRKNSIKNQDSTLPSLNNNLLLLLEHPPTFTEGKRQKNNDIDVENKVKSLGADYYLTSRGGQTTYHGPGQLVGYPIFYLKDYKLSTRCYVKKIETLLCNICSELSLKPELNEHTGVWLGKNKVAAIGILIRQYITNHGFALNINNDLNWYNNIIPCGILDKDRGVTNLEIELNRKIIVEDILPLILKHVSLSFTGVENSLVSLDKYHPELNQLIDSWSLE
ncbi:lipoyltransferase [Neoconidiobolus thromboides FSU 785]|nr:lipoyltransferase [Neoconidiobolus thromboides FSU 785]